jgi:putative NADH-flavin reductase
MRLSIHEDIDMHLALIGATGFIGSALRDEALARGHHVSALVGHPEKLPVHAALRPVTIDVLDRDALAQALRGHEAVISAFSGHAQADVRGYYLRGVEAIVDAVRRAGVLRLLMVGGAGSLEVAPGVQLLDTPQFPAAYRGTAEGARDALRLLRAGSGLAWTMLSPSAIIAPGERTGRYRLGDDALLVGEDGQSRISVQDYAKAMIDELERPAHTGRRFTVGY